MKTFALLFVLSAVNLCVSALSGKKNICNGRNVLKKDPQNCCKYPKLLFNLDQKKGCIKECSEKKENKEKYCFITCLLKDILSGEKDQEESDKVKFLTIFSEASEEKILSENWKTVIGNSLDTCYEKISEVEARSGKILNCVFVENFLNCPSPVSEPQCDKMKEMLIDCSKTEHYRINKLIPRFWKKEN
ncbi:CLUMA_CG015711, isoform A [Clunio marinus]|uniref:CLUMA_CG015711, isoform A n=1 Tax=Clunio marinus TaxID=568069 RepID=A0A1J1IPI8_9DIPT|nr:CLUMA_CG015711, isoform A [Clunio marinus]